MFKLAFQREGAYSSRWT